MLSQKAAGARPKLQLNLRISSGAHEQVHPTLRPSRSEESLTERAQEEELHHRVFRSQEHPEAPRQATTDTRVSQLMKEFCHLLPSR